MLLCNYSYSAFDKILSSIFTIIHKMRAGKPFPTKVLWSEMSQDCFFVLFPEKSCLFNKCMI